MHLSHSAHLLAPPSVLGSKGWADWIRETTGLRAELVKYAPEGKELPCLEGIAFFDKRGRFRQPEFSPYLALNYSTTSVDRPEKLYRQWVSVADLFARDLVKRGIVGSVALPPGLLDARPFQWAGLQVQVRYTFASKMPVDPSQFQPDIRRRVRKCLEAGYTAERSDDWHGIMQCLKDTEEAKNFNHSLDASSLATAQNAMGDHSFRGYVVRDPKGLAVSGGVRLHSNGSTAVNWLQGTRRSHLSDGVTQLMYSFVLEDLAKAGASDFDYIGANIRGVAAAKATWGIPLVPYLLVSGYDARSTYHTIRSTRNWLFRSRT